ncbi:MAG: hypothetical protein ACPGVU_02130 [Limisphaerales bacterium]
MDFEVIGCVGALIIAFAMWRWSLRLEARPAPAPEGQALFQWDNLPDSERTVERAEKFLEANPRDLPRRLGILMESMESDKPDLQRMRRHTLALIDQLPSASMITHANAGLFFVDTAYRDEVLHALTAKLNQGLADHQIHLNLGDILGHAAVPPTNVEEFRKFHHLPEQTPLPTKLDEAMMKQAISHYEAAGNSKDWTKAIAAERLAQLLSTAQRPEAIAAFERALELVSPENRASLLVDFGECLAKNKQREKAVEILQSVREHDQGGDAHGPAQFTSEAETIMGHLALDGGDRAAARKHLLASTDVQRCVENTSVGFPTSLAIELLNREPKAVAEYCETVLKEFTPGSEDFEELLKDAQKRV